MSDPNLDAMCHSTVTLSAPLPGGTGLPVAAGSVVNHYEIIRELGHGAMGGVFLARDTRLARLCAIKFMLKHSGAGAGRFLAEAQATARCKHESIVTVYEVDEIHGYPYMVLEYLEGRTLRSWMAARDGGDLPADVVLDLVIPVVRALVYAHGMGIVHRDLKPENIVVTDGGQVKVLDFGVAKWIGASETAAASASQQAPPAGPGLTKQGALIGTQPYMSPEQWLGIDITPQTDIWAVGVILYELLTGSHPLGPSSIARLVEVQALDIAMPRVNERRPDAGPLGTIIDQCLKKHRSERIGSARELLAKLERLVVHNKVPAYHERHRRALALVTVSTAILIAALIMWVADRNRKKRIEAGSAITDVPLSSLVETTLFPIDIPNPGFEQPTLASGERVRHISAGSAESTLRGWHGSMDVLGAHRPARGNQIVSLSDSNACSGATIQSELSHLGKPLLLPQNAHCLLRFAHGAYRTTRATFDVRIDNKVHHFLSTYDPNALKEEVIRFRTGNTTSTQLRFQSTTPETCGGPTIDDVSVLCTRMPDRALSQPRYLGSDIAALNKPRVGWGSYQVDSNWYGPGFKIGGVPYYKGIFAHAPSEVKFPLRGAYSTLNLCVGQDDVEAVGGDGSRVTVYGDGKPLWTTAVSFGPVTCMPSKSVASVQMLTLTADPLDGIFADTVEWVNAYVQ